MVIGTDGVTYVKACLVVISGFILLLFIIKGMDIIECYFSCEEVMYWSFSMLSFCPEFYHTMLMKL